MPLYQATDVYGASVTVQAGDVVQNTGRHIILVCALDPADDGDAVEVLPNRGVTITAATQIRVRCVNRHGSSFKVVRGL